jgi:hypothetical protein
VKKAATAAKSRTLRSSCSVVMLTGRVYLGACGAPRPDLERVHQVSDVGKVWARSRYRTKFTFVMYQDMPDKSASGHT